MHQVFHLVNYLIRAPLSLKAIIPTFDSGLLNATNGYYMNHFIIERMADNNRHASVSQPFNAILHHRNGPYG